MRNCKQPLFLKAIFLTPTDANLGLDFSPENCVILYNLAAGSLAPAHCIVQGSLYYLRLQHILLALSGLYSPRLAAEVSGLNINDDLWTPTNGICLSPSPKSNLVLRNQKRVLRLRRGTAGLELTVMGEVWVPGEENTACLAQSSLSSLAWSDMESGVWFCTLEGESRLM